jgi:hypothetical protein
MKDIASAENQYIECDGNHCMSCGGSEFATGKIQADGGYVWCEIECLDCGSTWTDTYTLTGVANAVLVKPKQTYVHTCSISFEVESNDETGSDLTGMDLRNALTERICRLTADEFKGETEIFDTILKDE